MADESDDIISLLREDIRFEEGLNACINCGTCTAICPAAELYCYDPREIVDAVQEGKNDVIKELLKSEKIWYCGECMSCKTRCPKGNVPGLIIMALRYLSQKLGYFVESEKGRQQLFIKRTVGEWILDTGYCTYLEGVGSDMFPEQGPIWDWRQKYWGDLIDDLGGNYKKEGPGALRKIPESSLEELRNIFKVTGAIDFFDAIEKYSREKATEMKIKIDDKGLKSDYLNMIYNDTLKQHNNND